MCLQVWRGDWRGRAVAIKRMNAGQASGVGFAQELAALSAVQHEHVLHVLAYNEKGDPDGYQYLVSPSLHCSQGFPVPYLHYSRWLPVLYERCQQDDLLVKTMSMYICCITCKVVLIKVQPVNNNLCR